MSFTKPIRSTSAGRHCPLADKRKIVEALIEKIVIGRGEIDITFSYLPSSEE